GSVLAGSALHNYRRARHQGRLRPAFRAAIRCGAEVVATFRAKADTQPSVPSIQTPCGREKCAYRKDGPKGDDNLPSISSRPPISRLQVRETAMFESAPDGDVSDPNKEVGID